MKYYNIILTISITILTNSILLASEKNNFGYGSFRKYTPKSSASSEHERHFQEFYDDLEDEDNVRL